MTFRKYREIFFANNGPGPYFCYFCEKTNILFSEVVIHHLDEDKNNNSIENLKSAHHKCHSRHHMHEPKKIGQLGGLQKGINIQKSSAILT